MADKVFGVVVKGDSRNAQEALRGIGKEAQRAVGAVGKGAMALGALSGEFNKLGPAVGGAAEKLGGLAMSMTGGPFAMGLAAGTLAIGGLAAAWRAYNFDADQAAEMSQNLAAIVDKQVGKIMSESAAKVDAMRKRLAELKEEAAPGAGLAANLASIERLQIAVARGAGDEGAQRINEAKLKTLTAEVDVQGELKTAEGLKRLGVIETTQAEDRHKKAIEDRSKMERRAEGFLAEFLTKRADYGKFLADQDAKEKQFAKDRLDNEQRVNDGIQGLVDDRIAYKANLADKEQAMEDDRKAKSDKRDTEIKQAAFDTFGTMANLSSTLVNALSADNSKMTADEKAKATAMIAINTATSIAGAIAAGAGVAWPANIAAIASGVAAVVAAFAQIASFAEGGFALGGTPNRDSINARLMGGEYVMSRGEVSAFRTMLTRFNAGPGAMGALMPAVAGTGSAGGRSGGQPLVINQRIENRMWQPDRVGIARMSIDQAKVTRDLVRRGVIKAG